MAPQSIYTLEEQRHGAPSPEDNDALSAARGLTAAALLAMAVFAVLGALMIAAWLR